MRGLMIISVLGLLLLPAPARAIPSMLPGLKDNELRLGLLGNTYLSKGNQLSQLSTDEGSGNLGISMGGRGVGNKGSFHYVAEGHAFYALGKVKSRYLDVSELYAGSENKEKSGRPFIYVGRKKFEWSDIDSYWSMGLFQPRFRWDYLSERENGLFGLFFGARNDYVQAHAYVSPLFIPEQGAPFEISRGTCRTVSPWFACPSSTVTVFGQPTAVNFNLDMPPIKKLIMHNGGGASLRIGKYKGPFVRASYAHKPMNQIMLAFEGRLNLAGGNIPATIHPRVMYHDIYAIDVGVQDTRHNVTFSAILERPHRDYTPPTWNTQESSNATVIGGTIRTRPIRSAQATRMEFSYQYRKGGVAPDQGPFVSAGSDFFEPRFSFQNAMSIAIFTPFSEDWAKKFMYSMKFINDTSHAGNVLVMDTFFYPWPTVNMNLGFDLLGSAATSPVDFIARYQRNDRVRGGISYVF